MNLMHRRYVSIVLSGLVAFGYWTLAPDAIAAPKVDGVFDLTAEANRVAQGPDGNMWVTLAGGALGNDVARVTPAGVVTEFDVAELDGSIGITAGPDGNMWVTKATEVSRFAPDDPAGAVGFPADIATAQTIVTGPDGNLWTASADKVLRITPAGVATPFTVVSGARGIASSGGLLWVADFGGARIVSVTTDGAPTSYNTGGGPQEVAGGPNGQVAYANPGTDPHTVGRLVAGGSPLTNPTPASDPFGVAFGPDGADWFAQFFSNDLGRLAPDGKYTRLTGFAPGANPRHIAAGPGNTLWVVLDGTDVKAVARVTGVDPAPLTPPVIPNVAPVVSKLSLTNRRFRVGKARTPVRLSAKRRKQAKAKVGTRIRFRLSEDAEVRLRIERAVEGRRRDGKCVKPTRKRGGAKRCTRWRAVKALVRDGERGANSVPFSGRIGRKALAPGRYRVSAVAIDSAGLRGEAKRPARFRIVR